MSEKTWLCVVCGTWIANPEDRVLTNDGPMHKACDEATKDNEE